MRGHTGFDPARLQRFRMRELLVGQSRLVQRRTVRLLLCQGDGLLLHQVVTVQTVLKYIEQIIAPNFFKAATMRI